MILPRAREDGLIAEDIGTEVVVYDDRTEKAHHLNRTAAIV
ncbi:MAG: hypothetical protein AB1806_04695 [Acidobacteriota bacterium]